MRMAIMSLALFATSGTAHAAVAGGWKLQREDRGCSAQAPSESGPVLFMAGDGSDDLMFGLEDPRWRAIQQGIYTLNIAFDDQQPWTIDAVGWKSVVGGPPGFSFLRPLNGGDKADPFMVAFTHASTMRVSKDGVRIAQIDLTGSMKATISLLWCLRNFGLGDPFRRIEPETR